ncbi:MAG: Carboxypeptidase regulatory-like domain [Desulfovibrionales bacterium]|nr:Carboxypeptidase regulatory-like domain [Desulfovibrionales bacterium]
MRNAATLLLVAFLTFTAAPALAAARGELAGTVTSQNGSLAPGRTVCLQKQPGGDCEAKAVTDAAGTFLFAAVAPGWEFVSVTGDDHLYGQWLWVAPDSSLRLNIRLQPKLAK